MLIPSLEQVPAPTWIAGDDGSIAWANGRFGTCFGGVDALSRSWMQAVHPADAPIAEAAWRQAVETGASFDVTVRLRVSGGLYR
jgi:PAS domain-containing protein